MENLKMDLDKDMENYNNLTKIGIKVHGRIINFMVKELTNGKRKIVNMLDHGRKIRCVVKGKSDGLMENYEGLWINNKKENISLLN